jgi:hypothetical protein
MMHKTWSIRDQPKESLKRLLEKKYKEINAGYKMLRKLNNIEDAKIMLEEIWRTKKFANDIELELIRREYNDGTTS